LEISDHASPLRSPNFIVRVKSMCYRHVSERIFKCGHRRKEEVMIEDCEEARKSGVRCTGDKLVEKEMGSSKKPMDCPDCNDEGYSRT
jgi:hypothetical protein